MNTLGDEITFLTQTITFCEKKICHLLFLNNFDDETSFFIQSPFFCEKFFCRLLVLSFGGKILDRKKVSPRLNFFSSNYLVTKFIFSSLMDNICWQIFFVTLNVYSFVIDNEIIFFSQNRHIWWQILPLSRIFRHCFIFLL